MVLLNLFINDLKLEGSSEVAEFVDNQIVQGDEEIRSISPNW